MESREQSLPQLNDENSTERLKSDSHSNTLQTNAEKVRLEGFKNSQKICNFYAQGKCRFGELCKFYHDPNIVLPQTRQERTSHPRASPQRFSYSTANNSRTNNYRNSGMTLNTDFSGPATFPMGMTPVPMPMPMSMPMSMLQYISQSPPQYNGNSIPNSHGMMPPSLPQAFPFQPNRNLLTIPPNQPVYCIDVECVATGIQHNARSVAQVAMVDQWNRIIFNAYIKQDVPIVSYLTEIHGITKEKLEEEGIPLADALAELRSKLSQDAILIGQSIHKDIHWLQLAEGMDYHSCINLSDLFRVWNPKHNAYTNFSLDHCAKVWLGIDRNSHEAIDDAIISMTLFNMFRNVQYYPMQLALFQQRTLEAPRIPGFSALHPVVEGCCMGNRKKCICGAPFE